MGDVQWSEVNSAIENRHTENLARMDKLDGRMNGVEQRLATVETLISSWRQFVGPVITGLLVAAAAHFLK